MTQIYVSTRQPHPSRICSSFATVVQYTIPLSARVVHRGLAHTQKSLLSASRSDMYCCASLVLQLARRVFWEFSDLAAKFKVHRCILLILFRYGVASSHFPSSGLALITRDSCHLAHELCCRV